MPREPNPTCNIYLASGAVFKLKLDAVPAFNFIAHPSEAAHHLMQHISHDAPGYNTLAAIDWPQVAAITYRVPSDGEGGRPPLLEPREAVEALQRLGGSVPSKRELERVLGCGHTAVDRALRHLESVGIVEPFDGPRRAIGYRLTGRNLPQG